MVTKFLLISGFFALCASGAGATSFTDHSEAGLKVADAAQLEAARTRDADALDAMMSPEFLVNGPEGEIWDRRKTVDLWRSRGIGHDHFERTIERATISGDVGIVMGREIVQPSTDSLAGQRRHDGGKAVNRRFTNVWLWKNGSWHFHARHANERASVTSEK